MNKHEQAQRFAEILLTSGLKGEWDIPTDISMFDSIASDAWRMADAMQSEADKRSAKGVPEAIKGFSQGGYNPVDPNISPSGVVTPAESYVLNLSNSKPLEWQPDWSVAPSWAVAWTTDSSETLWWSYAPYFKNNFWFIDDSIIWKCEEAPIFGYTGSWQDSLRKRPEGV